MLQRISKSGEKDWYLLSSHWVLVHLLCKSSKNEKSQNQFSQNIWEQIRLNEVNISVNQFSSKASELVSGFWFGMCPYFIFLTGSVRIVDRNATREPYCRQVLVWYVLSTNFIGLKPFHLNHSFTTVASYS